MHHFDVVSGTFIANPLATFWAASLLLEYLGQKAAAALLLHAVETVIAQGRVLTPDLGGQATTGEVTQAVIQALRQGQVL